VIIFMFLAFLVKLSGGKTLIFYGSFVVSLINNPTESYKSREDC